MIGLTYTEWRTDHIGNNYPFLSETVPTSDRGIMLDQGILIDACVSHYGDQPIWLSRVVVSPTTIMVVFTTYDEEERKTEILGISDLIDLNLKTVELYLGDTICGRLVFGREAATMIGQIPLGTHTFDEEAYQLEPSCLLSLGKKQVSGIKVDSIKLRGKVVLVESEEVRVLVTPVQGGRYIRFDAVGKQLSEDCCPDDYDPVEKISGILPDSFGNIRISPKQTPEPTNNTSERQLLRILPIQNGIKITLAR